MDIGTITEIVKLVLQIISKIETKDIVMGLWAFVEIVGELPGMKSDHRYIRLREIVGELKKKYDNPETPTLR